MTKRVSNPPPTSKRPEPSPAPPRPSYGNNVTAHRLGIARAALENIVECDCYGYDRFELAQLARMALQEMENVGK